MKTELRDGLKMSCGVLMQANGLTLKSKAGQAFVYAFWHGALAALGDQSPFVQICLMSGRLDELVFFPSSN